MSFYDAVYLNSFYLLRFTTDKQEQVTNILRATEIVTTKLRIYTIHRSFYMLVTNCVSAVTNS